MKALKEVKHSQVKIIITENLLFIWLGKFQTEKKNRKGANLHCYFLSPFLTDPVKYKAKQLRAEAEDLLVKNSDAKSDEEMDPKYRMRKVSLSISESAELHLTLLPFPSQLLRKFSDLMLVTALPDDLEICPICFEDLKLGNCSA